MKTLNLIGAGLIMLLTTSLQAQSEAADSTGPRETIEYQRAVDRCVRPAHDHRNGKYN